MTANDRWLQVEQTHFDSLQFSFQLIKLSFCSLELLSLAFKRFYKTIKVKIHIHLL